MKIENHTHWRSDHILAIARKVAVDELDPNKRKGFRVIVTYGKRGASVSGRAPYYGRLIKVFVGSDAVDPQALAFVVAHEMAHTRGMRHRQMRGSPRYCWIDGWRTVYAWATSYPVDRQETQRAPDLDARRSARREKCLTMVAQWERRKRAATNKVKVWTRRLKATEKVLAEAASRTEGTS